MDIERLISGRSRAIDATGIRRVFDLAARLKDPINLSIGQPDFPVPDPMKRAAADAIAADRNGYTVTQGIAPLREKLAARLSADLGWTIDPESRPGSPGLIVTSGTSGALWLAMLALVDPGDEVIIPDPYFVLYPHMVAATGGRAVRCDTYPDCLMTAARIEPLLTPQTKAVVLNSPGNPSGVVATGGECAKILDLCRSRGIILISDEIYDEFTYADAREPSPRTGRPVCPSPARLAGAEKSVLVVRGFGKTYGVTGWRLGYAAGPRPVIEEMTKLQQYTFVCPPAPLQWGAIAALDLDMTPQVQAFRRRRDMVVERLRAVTEVATPGGAFYAFPRIPARLLLSGDEFFDRCLERNVLLLPGNIFSDRDTHFRISYAVREEMLERGMDVLVELLSANG
jgi:aspartate/methionine/tyrosine aminotransferase